MKKKILIVFLVALNIFQLKAQNEDDALRYSFLMPMGTSRVNSLGGAFGALGADLSLTSQNPAGLALFTRNSEFTITPSFVYSNTEINNCQACNNFSYGMGINNIGVVLTFSSEDKQEGWVNTNLGITYNRLVDFRNDVFSSVINDKSSLADYFVSMANGTVPSYLYDFEEGLAFQTYLIDTVTGTQGYEYNNVYNGVYGEKQDFLLTSRGNVSELSISFSGNYEHKIYIGASFNIQSADYSHKKVIKEEDINDSVPNFNSFEFIEYLNTEGDGYNLKLGMIFKVNDWFRIGMAVHTPTFYKLTDEYNTLMYTNFDSANYMASSPENKYNYLLITPARYIASTGFILARQALFSLDVEAVNYTSAKLKSSDYNFINENNNIKDLYTWGINLKSGMEYNYGIFAFRGGIGYYSSPYKKLKDKNGISYNAGIRIRGDMMYVDLNYSFINKKYSYYLYNLENRPVDAINVNQTLNYFTATLGVRF